MDTITQGTMSPSGGTNNYNPYTGAGLNNGETVNVKTGNDVANPIPYGPSNTGTGGYPSLSQGTSSGSQFSINPSMTTNSSIYGTGPTIGDASNYRNNLESAYNSYQGLMNGYSQQLGGLTQLSPEEQSLQQQLTALNQSERQGLFNTQEQVIPMEFIQGQKAAMQQQADITRQALGENLNLAQNTRQNKLQALQAKISNLQNAYNTYFTNQKAIQDAYLNEQKLATPETDIVKTDNGSYLINKRTGEIIKSYGGGSGTGNGYDENALAYAQQYASTGMIPTGLPKGTFGAVAQIAKTLPKPDGYLADVNTGVKSSSLSSTQQDGITALYDLTKKLDELKAMRNSNVDMSIGTNGRSAYNTLRNEIIDLIARARTGAAINAQEEKTYSSKVPPPYGLIGSIGNTKIDGLKSSLSGKLDTSLNTNGLVLFGYSKIKLPDGNMYSVGQVIQNDAGQFGRVNADGSITPIS